MALNLATLFGLGQAVQPPKPNPNLQLALILQMLSSMMMQQGEQVESAEDVAAREVPVRPRVEPLGG
jgi:hypothetical protein